MCESCCFIPSQLPAPNMTVRATREAQLQCSGAFNLEADLPSVPFSWALYLFPSLLTGPKLGGSNRVEVRVQTGLVGKLLFTFLLYLSKCLYFV